MVTFDPALRPVTLFTVTVTVTEPVQGPFTAVTVYVVVPPGLAVTVAPVVADNPVEGAQLYVAPPLAVSAVPDPPTHIDVLPDMPGTRLGVTDIENVCTGPTQLLAVGVTVNTPVAVTDPVFVPVNKGIKLPLPDAPMPIVTLLLFQVYVVPLTFDENTSGEVLALLHIDCDVGVTDMIGVGFTFTVNVFVAPTQLLAVGVTVKIPLVCALPVLVAVNDAIALPLPDAPIPIVILLLFHV
jgi:hypothetical protein